MQRVADGFNIRWPLVELSFGQAEVKYLTTGLLEHMMESEARYSNLG